MPTHRKHSNTPHDPTIGVHPRLLESRYARRTRTGSHPRAPLLPWGSNTPSGPPLLTNFRLCYTTFTTPPPVICSLARWLPAPSPSPPASLSCSVPILPCSLDNLARFALLPMTYSHTKTPEMRRHFVCSFRAMSEIIKYQYCVSVCI